MAIKVCAAAGGDATELERARRIVSEHGGASNSVENEVIHLLGECGDVSGALNVCTVIVLEACARGSVLSFALIWLRKLSDCCG